MADWHYAMLLIAPLMLHWRGSWTKRLSTRRLRIWAVMLAASLAAYAVPSLVLGAVPPLAVMVGYMAIDLTAGVAVTYPRPANCAQRTIGALFAGMLCFDIGFFSVSDGSNIQQFVDALEGLGWVQWACLFSWGIWNVGKAVVGSRWSGRPAVSGRRVAR